MTFSDEKIQMVWEKGNPISGYDSGMWRLDERKTIIKRDEYGSQTRYGWNVDHIEPQSKGGGDELSNLRPLHWKNNAAKQDR